MSAPETEKERTDWRRIGLVATVLLVPGGFLLGAALAARRRRGSLEKSETATRPGPIDPRDR